MPNEWGPFGSQEEWEEQYKEEHGVYPGQGGESYEGAVAALQWSASLGRTPTQEEWERHWYESEGWDPQGKWRQWLPADLKPPAWATREMQRERMAAMPTGVGFPGFGGPEGFAAPTAAPTAPTVAPAPGAEARWLRDMGAGVIPGAPAGPGWQPGTMRFRRGLEVALPGAGTEDRQRTALEQGRGLRPAEGVAEGEGRVERALARVKQLRIMRPDYIPSALREAGVVATAVQSHTLPYERLTGSTGFEGVETLKGQRDIWEEMRVAVRETWQDAPALAGTNEFLRDAMIDITARVRSGLVDYINEHELLWEQAAAPETARDVWRGIDPFERLGWRGQRSRYARAAVTKLLVEGLWNWPIAGQIAIDKSAEIVWFATEHALARTDEDRLNDLAAQGIYSPDQLLEKYEVGSEGQLRGSRILERDYILLRDAERTAPLREALLEYDVDYASWQEVVKLFKVGQLGWTIRKDPEVLEALLTDLADMPELSTVDLTERYGDFSAELWGNLLVSPSWLIPQKWMNVIFPLGPVISKAIVEPVRAIGTVGRYGVREAPAALTRIAPEFAERLDDFGRSFRQLPVLEWFLDLSTQSKAVRRTNDFHDGMTVLISRAVEDGISPVDAVGRFLLGSEDVWVRTPSALHNEMRLGQAAFAGTETAKKGFKTWEGVMEWVYPWLKDVPTEAARTTAREALEEGVDVARTMTMAYSRLINRELGIKPVALRSKLSQAMMLTSMALKENWLKLNPAFHILNDLGDRSRMALRGVNPFEVVSEGSLSDELAGYGYGIPQSVERTFTEYMVGGISPERMPSVTERIPIPAVGKPRAFFDMVEKWFGWKKGKVARVTLGIEPPFEGPVGEALGGTWSWFMERANLATMNDLVGDIGEAGEKLRRRVTFRHFWRTNVEGKGGARDTLLKEARRALGEVAELDKPTTDYILSRLRGARTPKEIGAIVEDLVSEPTAPVFDNWEGLTDAPVAQEMVDKLIERVRDLGGDHGAAARAVEEMEEFWTDYYMPKIQEGILGGVSIPEMIADFFGEEAVVARAEVRLLPEEALREVDPKLMGLQRAIVRDQVDKWYAYDPSLQWALMNTAQVAELGECEGTLMNHYFGEIVDEAMRKEHAQAVNDALMAFQRGEPGGLSPREVADSVAESYNAMLDAVEAGHRYKAAEVFSLSLKEAVEKAKTARVEAEAEALRWAREQALREVADEWLPEVRPSAEEVAAMSPKEAIEKGVADLYPDQDAIDGAVADMQMEELEKLRARLKPSRAYTVRGGVEEDVRATFARWKEVHAPQRRDFVAILDTDTSEVFIPPEIEFVSHGRAMSHDTLGEIYGLQSYVWSKAQELHAQGKDWPQARVFVPWAPVRESGQHVSILTDGGEAQARAAMELLEEMGVEAGTRVRVTYGEWPAEKPVPDLVDEFWVVGSSVRTPRGLLPEQLADEAAKLERRIAEQDLVDGMNHQWETEIALKEQEAAALARGERLELTDEEREATELLLGEAQMEAWQGYLSSLRSEWLGDANRWRDTAFDWIGKYRDWVDEAQQLWDDGFQRAAVERDRLEGPLFDLSLKWNEGLERARQKSLRETFDVMFDYSALSPMERKLRTLAPFTTYQLRSIPFYAQSMMTEPRIPRLFDYYEKWSEHEREKRGLTGRFKGTFPLPLQEQLQERGALPEGYWALDPRQLMLWRGTMGEPFEAPAEAELTGWRRTAHEAMQAPRKVGMGYWPWAEIPAELAGVYGERELGRQPFGVTGVPGRVFPGLEEPLRRFRGWRPLEAVERGGWPEAARDLGEVLGQPSEEANWVREYYINMELAGMAQSGEARGEDVLAAQYNKEHPLYQQVAQEYDRRSYGMNIGRLLQPFGIKYATPREMALRGREPWQPGEEWEPYREAYWRAYKPLQERWTEEEREAAFGARERKSEYMNELTRLQGRRDEELATLVAGSRRYEQVNDRWNDQISALDDEYKPDEMDWGTASPARRILEELSPDKFEVKFGLRRGEIDWNAYEREKERIYGELEEAVKKVAREAGPMREAVPSPLQVEQERVRKWTPQRIAWELGREPELRAGGEEFFATQEGYDRLLRELERVRGDLTLPREERRRQEQLLQDQLDVIRSQRAGVMEKYGRQGLGRFGPMVTEMRPDLSPEELERLAGQQAVGLQEYWLRNVEEGEALARVVRDAFYAQDEATQRAHREELGPDFAALLGGDTTGITRRQMEEWVAKIPGAREASREAGVSLRRYEAPSDPWLQARLGEIAGVEGIPEALREPTPEYKATFAIAQAHMREWRLGERSDWSAEMDEIFGSEDTGRGKFFDEFGKVMPYLDWEAFNDDRDAQALLSGMATDQYYEEEVARGFPTLMKYVDQMALKAEPPAVRAAADSVEASWPKTPDALAGLQDEYFGLRTGYDKQKWRGAHPEEYKQLTAAWDLQKRFQWENPEYTFIHRPENFRKWWGDASPTEVRANLQANLGTLNQAMNDMEAYNAAKEAGEYGDWTDAMSRVFEDPGKASSQFWDRYSWVPPGSWGNPIRSSGYMALLRDPAFKKYFPTADIPDDLYVEALGQLNELLGAYEADPNQPHGSPEEYQQVYSLLDQWRAIFNYEVEYPGPSAWDPVRFVHDNPLLEKWYPKLIYARQGDNPNVDLRGGPGGGGGEGGGGGGGGEGPPPTW